MKFSINELNKLSKQEILNLLNYDYKNQVDIRPKILQDLADDQCERRLTKISEQINEKLINYIKIILILR